MRRRFRFAEPKFFEPAPDNRSKVARSQDDIINSIFAIDPVTKYPCNDISLVLSDKTKPEVAEFVRQRLQREIPALKGAKTPEEAEALAFLPGDSISTYKEKVKEYIRSLQLEEEQKGE